MKKFQKVIVLQCLQQRQVAKMSGPNENENARLNLELTRQVAINNQLRETVATLMSYFRMPPPPPPNDLIPAQAPVPEPAQTPVPKPAQAPVRRPAQAPTSGSGQNGFRGRRRNGGKNRQSWYENNSWQRAWPNSYGSAGREFKPTSPRTG
ncbi:uncharacterized protein [Chelonus insularis]|uniref:uncharacterized protein n=1 Tax=Chelonus insularis TaxID=460826 RepID=UPI00158B6A7B|nr:uncharacterized protein LOC118074961 [Chelonus insularis]